MGTRWQEDEECESWKAAAVWDGQRMSSLCSKTESPKYADSGKAAVRVKTLRGREKERKEKSGENLA